jgi:uncharacterized protein YycO
MYKKPKKILIASILSATLLLPSTPSFASTEAYPSESEIILDLSSDELQKEMKIAEENTKKAKSLEIDQKELKKELKELKKDNPEKYDLVIEQIKTEEAVASGEITTLSSVSMGTKGDVLVTYDQDISGWNHGHAAIVAINYDYIYEAMPDPGVRYYPNRWANYNTKKKMYVKGASFANYDNAVAFAKAQVGKPYSLAAAKDQTKVYYCSLLVWKSWQKQGFDLDGDGGLIVTPADLDLDSQTITY